MYFVYILQSLKDKRTYVGYTKNIEKRLHQHNTGQVISTKNRKPFKLLSLEKFKDMAEAKRKELWWKSGAGRIKLQDFFK